MNSTTLFLAFIFALIIFAIAHFQIQDQKLLNTVTKSYRGTRTERLLVVKLLKAGIPAQTIFHDLYLKNRNGKYCQIDLVVATKVGIIVLEVKKYSGWIFGTEYQTHWTQVLAFGKQKYRFYNPILQNKKHVDDLKKQLAQFNNVPFYSVIVFFGDCEFRNLVCVPKNTFLIKSTEAITVVKEIKNQNEPTTYQSKREIVNLLSSAVQNGDNKEISEKHIENIKKMFG